VPRSRERSFIIPNPNPCVNTFFKYFLKSYFLFLQVIFIRLLLKYSLSSSLNYADIDGCYFLMVLQKMPDFYRFSEKFRNIFYYFFCFCQKLFIVNKNHRSRWFLLICNFRTFL